MSALLKSLKSRLRNRDGFTLTEVMILGSLFLVLIVSFAAYQFQQDKVRRAREVTSSYKTFERNTKEKAVQPQSISRSEELDLSKME